MKIALIKRPASILAASLLLLFSALPVKAQLYNFRNYSLEDGLSQSEINCIYEDSRGYLWIGTAGGGLCRFDGKEFKTYEEKDGLCGQIITSVSEDASRGLIIGNQNGELCHFDGQKFSANFDWTKTKFSGSKIKFIVTDDNNNSIIGIDNHIIKFNGKRFEVLHIKGDTLKTFEVNCYKKDSRNILWIGTNRGLLVLKNQILLRVTDMKYISNSNITSLSEDLKGNIWALGLLLNEIISNSFKYAFKDVENGQIEIILKKISADEEYSIIIGDNAKGYDSKLLSSMNSTLGLELIKILAIQLNGTIERIDTPGKYYILNFKPLKD